MPPTADILIVGGGVIGIAIAIELARRDPSQRIVLIEKESKVGTHASGRNSGVLHAGFYYSDDSLKARFCREGNRLLTDYCVERGLRINRCGKLVVARNETELAGLEELFRRGQKNGVQLEWVSESEAREIEPRARTFGRAIFSPTTSSVDPTEVVTSLASDARSAGVQVVEGVSYRGHDGERVRTSAGFISAGFLINAAGLYADRIARDYGFSQDHRILPFKGVYLKGDGQEKLRTNIYPVPHLAQPFLGVHFTVTVTGSTKIGPTAIPAVWREQYSGLSRFSLREFAEITLREAALFLRNDFGFRELAVQEMAKYRRSVLLSLAGSLVSDLRPERYPKWGPPGIRAQLINIRTNKLEMDFRTEGDAKSLHVLNAVSPAFTSSLPFAAHVVDAVEAMR